MANKIIIVGAGIIGASIAHYLSKAGADVTVIEKNYIASEASGSSFGWLNANFPESSDYFNLRIASLEEYPNLLYLLSTNIDAQFKGCIFWEIQGDELKKHCEGLLQLNYPVELIDSNVFSTLEPYLSNLPPFAMKAAAEGAVDGEKLTQALLKQSNVKIIEKCEILNFRTTNSRVTGVKTTQGEFSADTTVISAGTSAQQLLAKLDINFPMNNRKGFIITTKPTKPIINHVLFGNDVHFKQHEDGRIVIGDWLHDIEGKVDLEKIAHRTMIRFAEYFPESCDVEIDKITCAYRPMPEDGYSVVGSPRAKEGIYIASTHSGITLAPIIGKLASQEILENRKSELLNSFRIERFN